MRGKYVFSNSILQNLQDIENSASRLGNSVSLIIQTSQLQWKVRKDEIDCLSQEGNSSSHTDQNASLFVFNRSIMPRLPKYLSNRELHFRIHPWNIFKHSSWYYLQLIDFLAPLTIAYMYLISRILIPSLLHYNNFLWDSISVSKMLFGNYLIFPQLVFFPKTPPPPRIPQTCHFQSWRISFIIKFILYRHEQTEPKWKNKTEKQKKKKPQNWISLEKHIYTQATHLL